MRNLALLFVLLTAAGAARADECSQLAQNGRALLFKRCMAAVPLSRPRAEFRHCLKRETKALHAHCQAALPQLTLAIRQDGYNLRYSVTNHGRRAIKDADVFCERIGSSGTVIAGTRQAGRIYQVARAGQTISALLPWFYWGWDQSASVRCNLIAAQWAR